MFLLSYFCNKINNLYGSWQVIMEKMNVYLLLESVQCYFFMKMLFPLHYS